MVSQRQEGQEGQDTSSNWDPHRHLQLPAGAVIFTWASQNAPCESCFSICFRTCVRWQTLSGRSELGQVNLGLLPSPSPPGGGHRLGNSAKARLRRAWAGVLGSGRNGNGRGGGLEPGAQLPSSPDTSCPCLSWTKRPRFLSVSRDQGQGVAFSYSSQPRRDLGRQKREDSGKMCV